ncbi:MAG: pirin family protein, partial [Myxococcales bacterium]|nr:pirin family protein [Myxococcales bacterium]
EVQLMSAGAGIAHSEYNHAPDTTVEFLQIWVLPREAGGAPGYQQHDFGRSPGLVRVVSPDGADGSLRIKQDMDLWRLLLDAGEARHVVKRRRAWVQVVRGTLDVNGARLHPGDGLAVVETPELLLAVAEGPVEALIFDLV